MPKFTVFFFKKVVESFLFTYPKVSKIHTSETKGSRVERNKNKLSIWLLKMALSVACFPTRAAQFHEAAPIFRTPRLSLGCKGVSVPRGSLWGCRGGPCSPTALPLLSSSSCTAVTFGPCWNLFVPKILQPHCHPRGRDTLCNLKYRIYIKHLMCNPENDPCSPYGHITTQGDQEIKFNVSFP